jgi:hypothetical protein
MVPEIDEDQIAMIALAMDPAGEPGRMADIGQSERAAGVRAVGMHGEFPQRFQGFGARSHGKPGFVKAAAERALPCPFQTPANPL